MTFRRWNTDGNEAAVLCVLACRAWYRPCEVAEEAAMPPSTVRNILNRLVESGKVERRGKEYRAR